MLLSGETNGDQRANASQPDPKIDGLIKVSANKNCTAALLTFLLDKSNQLVSERQILFFFLLKNPVFTDKWQTPETLKGFC